MIQSTQNDKIKHLIRLNTDNRFRKKSQTFIVEGVQENERALKFGYQPLEYFICEKLYSKDLPEGTVYFVSEAIYQKIAYRGNVEGIVGVYRVQDHSLNHFNPDENSSVMIVESIEKPGNLGAVLRSCEAFGIDALIVADTRVDFYNPNVIRSSVGCLFGMNIYQAENEPLFEFLKNKGYIIYTTFMDETAQSISEVNLNGKTAVLFGTEHSGLSDFWLDKGKNILIPMRGTIDSLNLSNAVAICCYEVSRQKSIK